MELLSENNLSNNLYPGELYVKKALTIFDSLIGGPYGRFRPAKWENVKNHLWLGNEITRKNLENTRNVFVDLLNEINKMENEADFNDIQKIIIKTTQKMMNCEIGEFRLMVLVHLAAQIGFILKPKELLNNLSYLAPGRRSYNVLKENNIDVHNFGVASQYICNVLNIPYNRNIGETILCESSPNRIDEVWDIIIKGSDSFWLDEKANPFIRLFNHNIWNLLN